MPSKKAPQIPLPKSWKRHVRSAMLHVMSLAQYAAVYNRSWAVDSRNGRVRLKAAKGRLLEELARKNEKIRIKDARMARITPHRRLGGPITLVSFSPDRLRSKPVRSSARILSP